MANVLLIEPDLLLASTYVYALKHAGHVVRVVVGAQDGIDAADTSAPDIVILELQLVAHSGIEFLCEFRSYPEWQKVPVIILSNVPPAEFQYCATIMQTQLGINDYHYKPQMNLKRLVRLVDSFVVYT